ncbi:GNAT family N-acetyltransferase, partial [Rhizobiaceae sp. 2RAB30]
MVDLLVTYMEMTSPPASPAVESPHAEVAVVRERLSRPAYLDIYGAVGEAVQWDERQRMDAADLDELLAAESSVVLVLRVEGRAAGL